MKRHTASLAIVLLATATLCAQQTPSSPEELAFDAVSVATNPASRLAAAEDFIAGFPKSSKRIAVARLVSEQFTLVRNPSIAILLLERAQSIFTLPGEWDELKPAALEVYSNADRVDDAFAIGADILSRKPYEFRVLLRLASLGAREARDQRLKYASVSLSYAARAIQSIEQNERQTGLTDEEWAAQKSELSGLYRQVAIIRTAQGNTGESKQQLTKAIEQNPKDPTNFALLGRLLSREYNERGSVYENEGSNRPEEKKKLDELLDEIVDLYAHAAGLSVGRVEYQFLLQQVIPDLTRLYRTRHNQITGLQRLIDKYRQ
jgi:tetratricopeptide (TPR) repeat protein